MSTTRDLYQSLNEKAVDSQNTPQQPSLNPESTPTPEEQSHQLEILETIKRRRDSFNPKEENRDFFVRQQHFSAIEAAKNHCNLAALRQALGNKDDIDTYIITLLINDDKITHYPGVQSIKQQYYLEKIEAKNELRQEMFQLNFSFASGNNYLNTTQSLLTKLIDEKKLIIPKNKSNAEAVHEAYTALEDELYPLVKLFYQSNGSNYNPRFINAISFGTACKLTKRLEDESQKAKAPVVANILNLL